MYFKLLLFIFYYVLKIISCFLSEGINKGVVSLKNFSVEKLIDLSSSSISLEAFCAPMLVFWVGILSE